MTWKSWLVVTLVLIIVFGAWGACWYFVPKWYPVVTAEGDVQTPDSPGVFGDMFGAVNALFAGLSFFGVVVALVLQSAELKRQGERQQELAATIEEVAAMQLRQMEVTQALVFAQNEQAERANLQREIAFVEQKIARLDSQMPRSWGTGTHEEARRRSLEQQVTSLQQHKAQLEARLNELSGT